MINTFAHAIFKQGLLILLAAWGAGCSFTGTEVGNGNKADSGTEGGGASRSDKAKKNQSNEKTIPTIAQASDPMGEDESTDTASDAESTQSKSSTILNKASAPLGAGNAEGAISAPDTYQESPDLILVLLAANCASPFSHNLSSPVKMTSLHSSQIGIAKIQAELFNGKWNLWKEGASQRYYLEAQITPDHPYGIKATNLNGVEVGRDFVCSDVNTENSATIPGITGIFKKISAKLSLTNRVYVVTWYVSVPGAGKEQYRLEQFEVKTESDESLLTYRASP